MWLVVIKVYALGLDYPISPLGYIPLNTCTLLAVITTKTQGGTSALIGKGRTTVAPSRSVIATSSHYRYRSLELRVECKQRSIGIPSVQRDHEVGKTSSQGSGEGREYEDAPKD